MSESHEAIPETEQEAVETEEDAPEEGTSEETFTDSPPDPDDQLHSRYEQMQADYTRKTQSLAAQRREVEAIREQAESWERLQQDPEFQRQALEALGYEVPREEQPYEQDQQFMDPRVDVLLEAEQQREAQTVAARIHDHITQLSQEAGVSLTERQQASLFRDAVDDGNPEPHRTEDIFNEYVDDLRAQQGEWEQALIASKRAPHVSQGGQEGSQRFDITDKDSRRARLNAVMGAED